MNDRSINHGRIVRNLLRLLDGTCAQSLYEVLPKGVRIWIPDQAWSVYPDVVVIGGQALFYSGHADKITNPCLLFEIVGEGSAQAAIGGSLNPHGDDFEQSLHAGYQLAPGWELDADADLDRETELDDSEDLADLRMLDQAALAPWPSALGQKTTARDMFSYCRTIPYLQEYVRVSRTDLYIEQYHRVTETEWDTTCYTGSTAVLELHITNTRLPLMEIYQTVDFSLLV